MIRTSDYRQIVKHDKNRWLVSYADFITLLFAFFVVMYAVSNISVEKYKLLITGFTKSFTSKPTADAPEYSISQEQSLHLEQDKKSIYFEQVANKARVIFQGEHIHVDESWMEISLKANELFKSGGTQLTAQAQTQFMALGSELKDKPGLLAIESYADNVSNWAASSARAVSIALALETAGIAAERIAVVGYADQSLVSNRMVIVLGIIDSKQRMLNPLGSDMIREQSAQDTLLRQTEEKVIIKEQKTSSGGIKFIRKKIRVKKENTP